MINAPLVVLEESWSTLKSLIQRYESVQIYRRASLRFRMASANAARVVSSGTPPRSEAEKVEDRFSDTRRPASLKAVISVAESVGVDVNDVRAGS